MNEEWCAKCVITYSKNPFRFRFYISPLGHTRHKLNVNMYIRRIPCQNVALTVKARTLSIYKQIYEFSTISISTLYLYIWDKKIHFRYLCKNNWLFWVSRNFSLRPIFFSLLSVYTETAKCKMVVIIQSVLTYKKISFDFDFEWSRRVKRIRDICLKERAKTCLPGLPSQKRSIDG